MDGDIELTLTFRATNYRKLDRFEAPRIARWHIRLIQTMVNTMTSPNVGLGLTAEDI
jgi:hypothetical protein